MLTIPRPCLAPINNLGWLASLLKFFMGLALVHFQKYCLLINYLGQFLELSKVRPLVTKHNNLFLSSITRKVQLNCNKFHLLITLYFNKHPLINFISIFRCLNAYYITISIIYISCIYVAVNVIKAITILWSDKSITSHLKPRTSTFISLVRLSILWQCNGK